MLPVFQNKSVSLQHNYKTNKRKTMKKIMHLLGRSCRHVNVVRTKEHRTGGVPDC